MGSDIFLKNYNLFSASFYKLKTNKSMQSQKESLLSTKQQSSLHKVKSSLTLE